MRQLFEARGEENGPPPRRQLVERSQECPPFLLSMEDFLGIEVKVVAAPDRLNSSLIDPAAIFFPCIGRNIEHRPVKIGVWIVRDTDSAAAPSLRYVSCNTSVARSADPNRRISRFFSFR